MKTKSKILKLIGIFFFLNSTITNAHIKCPFTVFGVTNDKCPVHNHNTFVENKGSKAKKNTPTLSKPKINLPPRPNLPSKPKISPQLKLPPRPKLPSIPTHAPKPKPPPPLDYRAIGRINDAAARTQENIQRKSSRLNQNFNDRKDALYNNTNRALENIHSNIEREKQNLSYEIDSISQQRRNFEINNPVDLQGLKNATKSAQDVVKFSTQGIGTSAIGKIKSPIRGTVSFDAGSNITLGDKLKAVGRKFDGGMKYYYDKTEDSVKYHYGKAAGKSKHFLNKTKVNIKSSVAKLKKSRFYKYFQERALSLFMESPDIIEVNHPDLPPLANSRPVYYMNGMFTDKKFAITQAENLSGQLRRTVRLVLNKSVVDGNTGSPYVDDFSESVYDRFWPQTLGSVTSLSPGVAIPFTQLNLATRWLTHILYHNNEPITLVTHSQGCIIARNAILTAMLLGKETKMKNSVTWIAAGNPLHDNEIELSMPAVYFSIHREDDFVANWVGMRDGNQGDTFNAWKNGWSPDTNDGALNAHLPSDNYFPFIFNLVGDTNHEDFRLFVRNDNKRYRITGNFDYKRTVPLAPPRSGTVSFVE